MSDKAEETQAKPMTHSGTSHRPHDGSAILESAVDPVYPVTLNFTYQGVHRSEQLLFKHPVGIPTPKEVVTLKFNDFGTLRRISGTVQSVIREFYGAGVVPGVTAGYIVQIELDNITDQPV